MAADAVEERGGVAATAALLASGVPHKSLQTDVAAQRVFLKLVPQPQGAVYVIAPPKKKRPHAGGEEEEGERKAGKEEEEGEETAPGGGGGGGEDGGDDEKERAELERRLAEMQERKKKVDRHIKALHDYNDIKDATQMLLGRMAEMEGVTTRDMYPRFDLDVED